MRTWRSRHSTEVGLAIAALMLWSGSLILPLGLGASFTMPGSALVVEGVVVWQIGLLLTIPYLLIPIALALLPHSPRASLFALLWASILPGVVVARQVMGFNGQGYVFYRELGGGLLCWLAAGVSVLALWGLRVRRAKESAPA